MRAPWEPMHVPMVAFDSGGGGPTYQTQSSNSYSSTRPPGEIAGKLANNLDNFWWWYQNGGSQAPEFFPGQTYAPMSGATQGAFDALEARGTAGSPVVGAAGQALIRQLSPESLDLGSNPYFGKAVQAYLDPMTRNLNESVIPNLRAQFEGAGRTGSGADFNTTMRAVDDFTRTTSNATSTMANQAFQQMLDRQISAAGLAPTIAAQDYADIEARLRAGLGRESYDQKAIDEAMARHDYASTAQPQWYAQMGQILQSLFPGGQTTGSGTSSGTAFGSSSGGGAGSYIGTGLAALGTAAKFLPFLGVSDARAKDILGRVGETDEGLPLYLYTYKGDNDPRIGPVAQEVAEIHPEAVARHPSGYLAVDYGQLMPVGGMM